MPAGSRDSQTVNQLVTPTVIRAADFDDSFFSSEAAREPDGRHHRLSTRTEHTEHLGARHVDSHQCGEARASYAKALEILDALKARGALSAEYAETPDKLKKAMAGCK